MSRFRRYFSRWQNWIGVLLILLYIGVAIFAPYLSPDDPEKPGVFLLVGKVTDGEPHPPSEKALLGMLPFGIDVFHALVWGTRDALQFGLIVTTLTALFGTLYGAIAGFVGNRFGSLLIRIADSFLAFPPLAGLVFLQQLYATTITALGGFYFNSERLGRLIEITGPMTAIRFLLENINPLMLSLIIFSWMPYARMVHSIVLTLKQTEFIQAARALGGSPFWIIRKHILRNSVGPAIVLGARDVGGVVLLQATLTFIGIGGGSIWGEMLAQGRDWVIGPGGSVLRYWWVFLPPTLAVMLFGIAWNMFGDSLNDVLEPTSQGGWRGRSFWNRKKQDGPKASAEPGMSASSSGISPRELPVAGEQVASPEPPVKPLRLGVDDPVLLTARADLSRDDLPRALNAYQHLIQRNRCISELLPDLAVLVKRFPGDPRVWQTLGDALTRLGDAQHAAQSYEQARKLSM